MIVIKIIQLEDVKEENRCLRGYLQEKELRIDELHRIISDIHQVTKVLVIITQHACIQ